MRIKEKFDTNKLFFTSDTHFYHENIIKYTNRPYINANHQNESLINNWNEVVPVDGNVFVLGDFIHNGQIDVVRDIVSKLNGKIWWILGNHDYQSRHERKVIADIVDGRVMDVAEIIIEGGNVRIFASHYPHLYWPRGCYHIHGHCISKESEILTNNGWKNFSSINKDLDMVYSDVDGVLKLSKIDELIINKNYNGNVYRRNSQSLNIDVTDKHRMCHYGKYKDSYKLKYEIADDFFKNRKRIVRISGNYNSPGIGWNDDILKLYILLAADGSINKKTNLGRLKVKKDRKIKYIKNILNNLKINYSENIQKDLSLCFNFKMPEEFRYLGIKGLDSILLNSNKNDVTNIIEAYENSDGCRNGNGVIIYSNKEKEIDLLQHIFTINGFSSSKHTRVHGFSNTVGHQLSVYPKLFKKIDNFIETEKINVKNELYWCIRTEHSNFFVRLNGKIHLIGNCHTGPNSSSSEQPPFHPLRYDVGVDNNFYKPIPYNRLMYIFDKQKLYDLSREK